jgi:hypothetical protein
MSGVFSKPFYQAVKGKTCADFFHPGISCRQNLRGVCLDAFMGAIKFYAPVVLVPMILKIKKWKEMKTWKVFLKDSARCFIFGFLLNFICFNTICFS